MIKLIVERDRPPTFNLANDQEVARHARISVNAIAELAGRYHWLCTYATEEKLFTVEHCSGREQTAPRPR